jgi:hypothetical protein
MPESAGLQAKTPDSAKARPEPRVTVEPIEAGYIEGMPSPATIARTLEDPAEMARANSIARRAVSNRQVLKLQRSVGNRVAGAAFGRLAQRVPITASTSETLYNQENAGTGQATASSYGGDKTYDITRQGNTGATVLVKIKFLSQARNTTPPGPNPPAGTPRLGQMLGSPTQFPDGDERRAWATNMAAQAVTHWNGHVSFVSDTPSETAGFDTVRLPVTFQSEAVFGIDEDAHNTVIVHGTATTAGTDGHPIDAGNWYMNKGTRYPANDDVIYAHEYGHLIGIPDEYSQSNEQMNALLHQASPGDAAASLATLDEETVRRMAHTAIARPLFQQFRAAMPPAVAAFNAQGRMVKRKMSDAAKDAVLTSAVQEQLRDRLLVEATERMDAQVSQTVAFQTTTNFSNKSRAGEGVDAVFNAAALSGRFRSLYASALDGSIPGGTVDVSGLGDVAINISSAVWSAGVGGGANQASASAVAGGNVGAAAPASGLPEMPPPDTLVGQIGGLPATWADAGSAVESSITPAAFAAKMQAIMPTAAAAMAEAVVAAATGGTGPAALATSGQLYRRAYSILANAAREAATQLASELVQSQVEPVIQTSVTAFSTALDAEVARVMTMSPAELAAAGNPDPNLRQFVQDMKGRLDADKAATASTGRNPLGATGGTAPDQDVTYSVQSLMGSNQTTAVRADQFRPMADQFNANFKATTEEPFRPETT